VPKWTSRRRKMNPRPTEEQWAGPKHRAPRALSLTDFRSVSLRYENGRLKAVLCAISRRCPRAIGRAAAICRSRRSKCELRNAPAGSLPVATYTFINTPLLQHYFNGMASREQLAPYVAAIST
jgi:hypothetical protein